MVDSERAQLLFYKAQAHASMGQLVEGLQAAREAAELAPVGSDLWGEAQRVAAAALIDAGRSAEGDALAAWAVREDVAPDLSPAIRATLLAVRVRGLVDLDRPGEAMEVAHLAVDAARASGSLDATVRALDALLFAMPAGEVSDAIAAGASLIQAAEEAGDAIIMTRARINTASILNRVGLFEDARAMLMQALSDAKSRRMRILEGAALQNLGMSHARLGDLDTGIEYERQAGRIADECQVARLRIHARTYEVVFLVWRGAPGDLATALALSRWLRDETKNHPALQLPASFALARAQLARRAVDAALSAARDAYERLVAGPVEEWEEYVRLTLVEALLAAGQPGEAHAVLDTAFRALVERARNIRHPYQRSAFLRRNDEVDRLVHLARERLGRTLPPLDDGLGERAPTMGPGSGGPFKID
jgi:tetratricopeptide (TPR) repeat protein